MVSAVLKRQERGVFDRQTPRWPLFLLFFIMSKQWGERSESQAFSRLQGYLTFLK